MLATLVLGCGTLQVQRPLVAADAPAPGALTPPLTEAWRYNAEAGFGPNALSVYRSAVLVATRQGEVHLVDPETGKRIGKQRFGDAVEGAPMVLDGRTLVVPLAEGRYGLTAYDLVGAQRLWGHRDAIHLVGAVEVGDMVVAAGYDGAVRGLTPRTGDERWHYTSDALAHFVAEPIALGDGHVAFADDEGTVVVLDARTGAERWTHALSAPVHEALAADGARVYVPTTRGRLVALDVATGREAWAYEAEDARTLIAAPAVGDGAVVLGGSDGVVRLLDARTGAERWRRTFDGNTAAAPVIADGVVYVGTLDRQLVALAMDTGEERWRTELAGRIKSALVAGGEHLYVLTEPRYLYAFRRSAGAASR